MKFECHVYSGSIYLGMVGANTIPALKRAATIRCNGYYQTIDKMVITRANGKDMAESVTMRRVNAKAPNNTIVRGAWC